MGICRLITVPQPSDALILQTLTEHIYPQIKKDQITDNAYYSRDKANFNFASNDSGDYSLNWHAQWIKMQKEILKFKKTKKLIGVTDLSNYFDSIDLSLLRENLLAMVETEDEVLIDLLFRIFDGISWKPDYLPYKNRSLPTSNMESLRLMAHLFLFEIDKMLHAATSNNYTRWMDDITFGVDSPSDAIRILRDLSDVLKTKGLAINLAKTDLYNSSEFEKNFMIKENKFLDSLSFKKTLTKSEIESAKKEFKKHLKDKKPRSWDKVTKRYFTLFHKHKIDVFDDAMNLYINGPKLRPTIFNYFIKMGYSKKIAKTLIEIVKNIQVSDDISLFYLVKVVTTWHVPVTNDARNFLNEFILHIKIDSNPFNFYCLLLFKTKYDHPDDLLMFLQKNKKEWQKNSFLRRQAIAAMARIFKQNSKVVEDILNNQMQSGAVDVISLAKIILDMQKIDRVDFLLHAYLFPKALRDYKLSRFLVLCSVLNSEKIRNDMDIKQKVKKIVKDPYYQKWLNETYNIT